MEIMGAISASRASPTTVRRDPDLESMMSEPKRDDGDTGTPVGPLGLRVGQRARRTQTVTARDVELYAEITGDRNPLHFDVDFAARTRFGRLVAQGGIASGMLNALVAMDLPGAGTVFMSQSLKYLAPTYLGDTLTAEVEVLALKPDKPVCHLRATISNQDGTRVLEGECWTYTLGPA